MRELAISIYLLGFKVVFTLFKLFPLKNKVTFVVSFPDNSMSIYKALQKQKIAVKVVFLCNNRCFDQFKKTDESTFLVESRHLIHTIVGIYHLATSKQVIVDNYYGFLAVTRFKKGVTCTQIWHAVGAIKQFGTQDPSNVSRTSAALKRFKQVYERFDQFAIGSSFMGDIFKEAFLVKEGVFLTTGIPRTDFFFDQEQHARIREHLYKENPLFKGKKVILYAPTFRKGETEMDKFPLDIKKMYASLSDNYVIIVKLHPLMKLNLDLVTKYQDFVFDLSNHPNINELLIITDILITDYSSIPMEFVLLKRKMIFFAYDLEDYKQENGFWEDYENSVPGPVVKDTNEVIDAVITHNIDLGQLDKYAKKWTEYCHGDASKKLIAELF